MTLNPPINRYKKYRIITAGAFSCKLIPPLDVAVGTGGGGGGGGAGAGGGGGAVIIRASGGGSSGGGKL